MVHTPAEIEIAQSLECDPALLPFLPYLLQDIEELGGMTTYLYSVLASPELPSGSTVLDLGCGKGVISCEIAKRFGWSVHGVDLFDPFIENARQRARDKGVESLCRFEHGNARDAVKNVSPVDVLVLFSVGRLFGTIHDTVGELRKAVKPQGHLAIEEMYLAPGVTGPTRLYGECLDKDTTLRQLTAHGDRIVDWREYPPAEIAGWNKWALQCMEQRTGELLKEHPELECLLHDYNEMQRQCCEVLDTELIGGVWLLERAPN
ncbi:class I SAM-dependent methyltransferase [bacterium]|nr:class I SAM-dependent methyltransferase [bacterium]MBU1985103.1 class I SAM-dependent methyltransferase [bacterium]